MIRSLLLAAVALLATGASAQVPYTESFGTADRGIAGDCSPYSAPSDCATHNLTGVDWAITGNVSGLTEPPDFFLTSGGALVGQDLDEEVCWNSPQLTASGAVEIQVDLSETGTMESGDYVDVGYSVDGGAYAFVPNVSGGGSQTVNDDFTSLTVTSPTLTPSTTLDVRICADNNASTENHVIEEVRVAAPSGQSVTLAASPADGGSIEEAAAGSPRSTLFDVTLTTSDGDPTASEVTVELNLVVGTNGGDFTPTVDGGGVVAPITLTFPSGTSTGFARTVEVTADDDAESEGAEAFQFALQNPSGATVSGAGTFDFTILDDDDVAATAVRINEIRVDQANGTGDEYAELSGTPGWLDGLTYVVIGDSGANGGVVEEVTSLDGASIPADGYFLLAEGSYSLGGTPDLVATLSFENDQNATHLVVEGFTGSSGDDLDTDDDGVLDVTPWTSVVDAVGLVETPVGGNPYYGDALGFDDVGPNGSASPEHVYRNEATGAFMIGDNATGIPDETPGVANPAAIDAPAFGDVPGYRLLSLPFDTVTFSDIAEADLVQGVDGQYPGADPNTYDAYDGTDFVPIPALDITQGAGLGFFKYFFDVDVDPPNGAAGGGTSRSNELSGFTFSLAATPLSTGSDHTLSFGSPSGDVGEDGAYMIGNPFPEPFDLFGITEEAGSEGTLSSTFLAWDPALHAGAGDYVALDGSVDDGTFVDVYQGLIATVAYAATPSSGPILTFLSSEVDASAAPTFYGRRAPPLALGLDLTGTTATGVAVGDGLADLWFHQGASVGPDRVDAAEVGRPGSASAQLALVEGGRYRSVRAVPAEIEGVLETPVAFRAAEAGTFTVGFDPAMGLPEGVTARLLDRVTGLEYVPGQEAAFESAATDWTERFTLAVTGTAVASEGGPGSALAVGEVFPNPSAGRSRLVLEVDVAQRVTVTVFDAIGRVVATAYDGDLPAGAATTVALPGGLAPGAYAVRVAGATFAETRRLVVVR